MIERLWKGARYGDIVMRAQGFMVELKKGRED